MAEHRKLFEPWMNDAQTFLVPGKISTTTGVDEKASRKVFYFAASIACRDIDCAVFIAEPGDRPALAHFCAGSTRMFEQQMIERGALDLKGVGLNCLRSSRFTWTSRCPSMSTAAWDCSSTMYPTSAS